jgi:pimeloyl-ACP methyl ester carboxylesterase
MALEPTTGEIEVAGITLRYLQAGDGPEILFLHGASGAGWNPLLDRLSADWRVIAPEHPGFGLSPIPEWMMSTGDLAFFYLDLLQALNLHHLHLVGHDVGGWIAAEMAIRNTEWLSSLTLIAPAGVAHPQAPFGDVLLWSTEEFARRQFRDPKRADDWLQVQAALGMDIVLQNRAGLARLGSKAGLSNPQLPYWLHRIDIPTLLIWGKDDEVTPFACHEAFMREIPHAELFPLALAGHALPIECAWEISRRLTQFFQGARG